MIITPVKPSESNELRAMSILTFHDAFSQLNKKHNLQSYYKQAFSIDQIASELTDPNSQFYWTQYNDINIGYMKLNWNTAQTEPMGDEALEVQRIYLTRNTKRKGFGKKMIDFAEDYASISGYKTVWLGVWELNLSSIAFYEKCGYEIFSQHEFPFGDEIQTDLLMKKTLNF